MGLKVGNSWDFIKHIAGVMALRIMEVTPIRLFREIINGVIRRLGFGVQGLGCMLSS